MLDVMHFSDNDRQALSDLSWFFGPGEVRALEEALQYAAAASRAERAAKAIPLVGKNRVIGNAFRDHVAKLLEESGFTVLKEVRYDTPLGKRFIDIEVYLNGKLIGALETKHGNSRYRTLQRLKDQYLFNALDGYVVRVLRGRLPALPE